MNISGINDFRQWRKKARELLHSEVHPSQVNWSGHQQTQLFFQDRQCSDKKQHTGSSRKAIKVPAAFMHIAQAAACYRDDHRWSLLYSILWRLTHDVPHLLHLSTDPEVKKFKHMQKAVHRDVHKMHAFVRFKKKHIDDQPWYVSWFEPSHLIVAYTANFFVKRFNTMNWSILTPDACAHWNQQQLTLTKGAVKSEIMSSVPDDVMDDFWRQYYRSIFNPARLKTQAMQSEMPKKYWHNLPEANLIQELTREAADRTSRMLINEPSDANRLRKKSRRLRQQQDQIRKKNQSL